VVVLLVDMGGKLGILGNMEVEEEEVVPPQGAVALFTGLVLEDKVESQEEHGVLILLVKAVLLVDKLKELVGLMVVEMEEEVERIIPQEEMV